WLRAAQRFREAWHEGIRSRMKGLSEAHNSRNCWWFDFKPFDLFRFDWIRACGDARTLHPSLHLFWQSRSAADPRRDPGGRMPIRPPMQRQSWRANDVLSVQRFRRADGLPAPEHSRLQRVRSAPFRHHAMQPPSVRVLIDGRTRALNRTPAV